MQPLILNPDKFAALVANDRKLGLPLIKSLNLSLDCPPHRTGRLRKYTGFCPIGLRESVGAVNVSTCMSIY